MTMKTERLEFRIDEDSYNEVAKAAAGKGLTVSDYVRSVLHNAIINEADHLCAPMTRLAIREELNRWLDSERVQKSFSADDFFARLSVDCMAELAELRQLVNACLWLLATNTESLQRENYTHKARDGKDYAFTRAEWYEAALENGGSATLDDSLR